MDTKTEPSFKFVGSREHKDLYAKEQAVLKGIGDAATYRVKEYNEDRFGCAIPEILHMILHSYENKAAMKAINAYLKDKDWSREKYIAKRGAL